jgi:hypothetical protein
MDEPRAEQEPHAGMTRRDQLKAPPRDPRRPVAGHLRLASVGQWIPVAEIDSAGMAVLVVEDLCWRIALDGWKTRRPSWWRRSARAAWRGDGETVQTERDRVALMAREAGIWT